MSEIQTIEDAKRLRPLHEWHEDYGPVLWWWLPISQPPHIGTPDDDDWGWDDGDESTHWTPIIIPDEPVTA